MSNWTHVAGIVRIDSLRFDAEDPDFDKIFGESFDYDNMEEMMFTSGKIMPCGSEGTLEKSVYTDPDESSVAAYVVSVFGDLRDHDDPKEIVDWFKECLKDLRVRQAVITVNNELNGTVTWTYGE